LFTPEDRAESLIGDLVEEFSSLAVTSDLSAARRWYWRQTFKTIACCFGDAFRVAPLSMLFAVSGGFWLIGFATRSSAHLMRTFLDAHQLYQSEPSVYLFWLKFPLETGRVILCAVVGALVALIAHKKEMAAVVTLALIQGMLFFVSTVALIVNHREWLHWFLFMLPWITACSTATIIGGAVVRKCRASGNLDRSVTVGEP